MKRQIIKTASGFIFGINIVSAVEDETIRRLYLSDIQNTIKEFFLWFYQFSTDNAFWIAILLVFLIIYFSENETDRIRRIIRRIKGKK